VRGQALADIAVKQASQLPYRWYEHRSDPLARAQSLALNASFGRAVVKGLLRRTAPRGGSAKGWSAVRGPTMPAIYDKKSSRKDG
jgi:hypothetical protein